MPIFGGYVDVVRRAREKDGGVVLVDAGDGFQGTLESNSNEGAAVIAAENALRYSAMAIGNHEFDFGPEGPRSMPRDAHDDPQGALKARLREARFPILSENLTDDGGKRPAWQNLRGSTMIDVAGVHVGLVGLLTREAEDVVKRPLFAGLHTTALGPAAAGAARALRGAGADLVVVVAHAGGACDRFDDPKDLSHCAPDGEIFRFARGLPPGLVDVIVGGHVDAAVAHVVNGMPIVVAPSHLVAFSRVDVTFDRAAHTIVAARVEPPHALCSGSPESDCNPGEYDGAAVVPSADVTAAIAPALEAARALSEKPLGARVEAPFPVSKSAETALGNLFADLLREGVAGADAAFANAGSLRAELPEGELTHGKLFHVMPFDNELAQVRLTGAELSALVLANLTQSAHGRLSLSGIVATVTCRGGTATIALERPNGAKIRANEMLTVATNDFLALGGDGLIPPLGLPEDRIVADTGKTVFTALAEGLAKRRAVRPDDPALYDPRRPRVRLPEPWPVTCGGSPK